MNTIAKATLALGLLAAAPALADNNRGAQVFEAERSYQAPVSAGHSAPSSGEFVGLLAGRERAPLQIASRTGSQGQNVQDNAYRSNRGN